MRPALSPLGPVLALAALAALPVMAFGLPARAQAVLPPGPQITVTGEGKVEAAPDLATITLGVTTQGATAAEAMAANAEALAKVLENLRAAGIAERDLQTSGLNLNPLWTHHEGQPPRIEGFQASNMLTVRVRALDGLGDVLDAAVKDGANTLNGLDFGIAAPEPLLDEARRLAVADARRRAEVLAGAAGVTLGPVVAITESTGIAPPAPMYRMEAASLGAGVPVAGGEVALSAQVTVVWELSPAP